MSELLTDFPFDVPAQYQISVIGVLDSSWVDRYWGMNSSPGGQRGQSEQTLLVGEVADQAALIGIFNSLYKMHYTIVSVERIQSIKDPHEGGTKEKT